MTYRAYRLLVDDEGEFDREFHTFAERSYKRAARLLVRLRAFPDDPEGRGMFLRGSCKRELYLVGAIDDAALVAVVDHEARTIKPVRFLEPEEAGDREGIVRWAEEYLGI